MFMIFLYSFLLTLNRRRAWRLWNSSEAIPYFIRTILIHFWHCEFPCQRSEVGSNKIWITSMALYSAESNRGWVSFRDGEWLECDVTNSSQTQLTLRFSLSHSRADRKWSQACKVNTFLWSLKFMKQIPFHFFLVWYFKNNGIKFAFPFIWSRHLTVLMLN